MSEPLTLDILKSAVAGTAAAFRCRATLQPAGGEGTKVFPPTYAGAVYATEKRRMPGYKDPVECVLLDSVQSQANRMEEALQQAIDAGRVRIPLIEVDFTPYFPGHEQPEDMRLLDPVGKITSLQVPHRIADAILRDSLVEEDGNKPFRANNERHESRYGHLLRRASPQNATALFELCPTALVFGMWDSTGPKGGLGAKFERAMVSEIVGINAVFGVKTSSRIDPLGIQKDAGPLYRRADGGYTVNPDQAMDEMKEGEPTGRKLLYKPNKKGADVFHDPKESRFATPGRPSEANHGNVAPGIDYRRDQNNNLVKDENGKPIPVGGATIASAEQTIVISLPALRRLRFPINGKYQADNAARIVLTALGLCSATLAAEAGFDLRSRCLLWPAQPLKWELLDKPGEDPEAYELNSQQSIELLTAAVTAAIEIGLRWPDQPLELKPSDELVRLIVKSQQMAVRQGGEREEGSE